MNDFSFRKFLTQWSVLLLLALNILPSFFLPSLEFNNAPEIYLPKDQPAVIFEQQLRTVFPDDKIVMVLFSGDNLYSSDFLVKLKQATEKINQNALIDRVINVTEMEHISATEDGFEVSTLLGKERLKKLTTAEQRFQYAQTDRFAKDLVVSSDKESMSIIVRAHLLSSTLERIEVLKLVDSVLTEYDLSQYVVAHAGPIVTEVEQFHSMIRDTMIFVPGTMFIGILLIWIMFRRVLAVVVTLLVSGAVVNCAVLLFVLFDLPYTLVDSMVPPLLSALSTAFLVHFFNALQQASSYGFQGAKRVSYALEHIKKPSIYTALTTALGLSSLAVSPIPPINHFGLISAAGTLLLLFLVLYVVPAIFVAFDQRDWNRGKALGAGLQVWMSKMLHLAIRHAGVVLVLTVVLMLMGIPYMARVTAETNMLKFFPAEHKVTIDTQLIEDKMSGIMPIEVSFFGDQRDAFKKYAYLNVVRDFEIWVKQQPEVDKANSIVDFVEEMHYAFQQDEASKNQLPNNDPLVSQYFLVYDGNEIYEMVNREFDHARVMLSLNVHNSSKIRAFIERVETYLSTHSNNMRWEIGGNARLFSDQDVLLIQGQLYSLLIAALGMLLVMLVLWKKPSYALITMIPNLSPVLGIFILMGIFNIWLDMATAMIASVAIGIAVDDTIHIFHGFKKRMDAGRSVVFALVHTYFKAGRAVVVTTIILCSQFLLLSFSEFIPTAHFGLLTATGLVMALLFDLLLLPAILVLFFRNKVNT